MFIEWCVNLISPTIFAPVTPLFPRYPESCEEQHGGQSGPDTESQEKGRHSERRHGRQGQRSTLRHHLLWREWSRKVYQPRQGLGSRRCFSCFYDSCSSMVLVALTRHTLSFSAKSK